MVCGSAGVLAQALGAIQDRVQTMGQGERKWPQDEAVVPRDLIQKVVGHLCRSWTQGAIWYHVEDI